MKILSHSLLALSWVFCSHAYSQNTFPNRSFGDVIKKYCYGDYPTYYTKSTVKIYQDMTTNSAVIDEIAKGIAVWVTNSSTGDIGWWEVCYNGSNGWVKKSLLTKNPPSTQNEPKKQEFEFSNQEVGFDPFIGKTTTSVNFRTGPSKSDLVIKTLEAGAQVYVYSNNDLNGYFKIIDISTSEIGWVHKSYIKHFQNVNLSRNDAFQSKGYIASSNSEIKIINKSAYAIKLIISDDVFILEKHSEKIINIKPGKKNYIATAPGLIPVSGHHSFESNNGYEWEFWVSN
jgi:uncharacterized protein YgiM (DUF1202 family)